MPTAGASIEPGSSEPRIPQPNAYWMGFPVPSGAAGGGLVTEMLIFECLFCWGVVETRLQLGSERSRAVLLLLARSMEYLCKLSSPEWFSNS